MVKHAHAFEGNGPHCEAWLPAYTSGDPATTGTITARQQCGYPRESHVPAPGSHIQAIDCGCQRHTSHAGCGWQCSIGHGCTGIVTAKDTRVCGCTVHASHGDCRLSCSNAHCGYTTAAGPQHQPTTVHVYLGDTTPDTPMARTRSELHTWWMDLADSEAKQVIGKAVEYGSRDLIEIGHDLARCMKRIGLSDQQAAELGVYFYLRGKMARWTEAVADGRMVSDDTLTDIGVYVRMAQRIRSHGGWPGVKA